MSFAATLIEFTLPALSFGDVLRSLCLLALVTSLLMFFRPLLSGMRRALVLAVRARFARKGMLRRGTDHLPGQRA